jgi:hypothetical protein
MHRLIVVVTGVSALLLLVFASGAGARSHKSPWSRAAKMTRAERQDFDLVNADRAMARVGPVSSAAVLQKIANKRVREMAARHSDYAGHDVSVDLKRADLCFKKSMEIEDELTGGGGGDYPQIEQNPEWTEFADAILTTGGSTYTVEDYVLPCGQHPHKPLKLPKGSLKLDGVTVSVGTPGPSAALTPVDGPIVTVTNQSACSPAAALYAVIDYSGTGAARISGSAVGSEVATIDQPVALGRSSVLLASGPTDGQNYGFELSATANLRLPDRDTVMITLPDTAVGAKAIEISPNC